MEAIKKLIRLSLLITTLLVACGPPEDDIVLSSHIELCKVLTVPQTNLKDNLALEYTYQNIVDTTSLEHFLNSLQMALKRKHQILFEDLTNGSQNVVEDWNRNVPILSTEGDYNTPYSKVVYADREGEGIVPNLLYTGSNLEDFSKYLDILENVNSDSNSQSYLFSSHYPDNVESSLRLLYIDLPQDNYMNTLQRDLEKVLDCP